MKFTKFAIVLIFLLSLTAFVLTGFLATVRENEKEKRISLQNIRLQLEDKLKILEEEKESYQKQIETLNAQLQEAISKSEQNATEIERLKSDLAQKSELLSLKSNDVEELQKAIQISQDRNRELESTLEKLESDLNRARQESSGPVYGPSMAPDAAPEAGSSQLASPKFEIIRQEPSKPTVPEKKDQVAESKAPSSSDSLQAGKVLLVNRKFNFVVLNIGTKQGLKVGDAFMVFEGNNKIARVEVEKLYDDFAAAKILENLSDVALLKEGNLVARV